MMLFTIDPGDNTAIVFWSDFQKPYSWRIFSLKSKQKKELSTAEKIRKLAAEVKEEFELYNNLFPCDQFKLIIEGVGLWGSSAKSNAAALRGDSFRLAYTVGAFIQVFHDVFMERGTVELVSVQNWKGNLPTPVLISEVESYIKKTPENEHVACAIGIGMNHFGKLGG